MADDGKLDEIVTSITGRADICAESTLVFRHGDPFVHGIK
ncbi:MAG: proline racemase family protein [Actinomycetia bacterium]|nr:proline racemase family protein [Actinomycetes bacterium]MCP4085460.1 proline racemase family protein [Actinomycetes bacterium]